MNLVDIIIFFLVIFTILRGVEVGLIRQASSLVGIVGGVLLGSFIVTQISATPAWNAFTVVATIILLTVITEVLGAQLKLKLHDTVMNKIDRSLGGVMGIVTCLALVWLGSTLITAVPSVSIQQNVRDSRIIAWMDGTLPPATDVISQLERTLAQTGLPEFLGEAQLQVAPDRAELPNLGEFDAVVAAATPSIVELDGRSCQGLGVGSGFVVDDDLVITNAHVVGGMRYPYVSDENGRHAAEVVAFDPELDIAVLKVANLAGEPLDILDRRVDIGTAGVVLGYPNGGPFVARPARAVDIFRALGRDIYDEDSVEREVYALRAEIEPGNSGGPLLSADGDVIGVIFARSTAYQGVGYAVTTPAIVDVLEEAETNPSAGTSTRCLAG